MNNAAYEPKGVKFFSQSYQKEMILVTEGHAKDWICYKHPDGQWVTLRKATQDDRTALGMEGA